MNGVDFSRVRKVLGRRPTAEKAPHVAPELLPDNAGTDQTTTHPGEPDESFTPVVETLSSAPEGETLTPTTQVSGVESPGDRLLQSFLHEIDLHCAWAELAYTSLVMALNDRDAHGYRGPAQHQRIFFYIHAFLTHAAIISTMLWPSDQVRNKDLARVGEEMAEHLLPIRKERGRRLRKALGIKAASPLMDERLRDYVEDFDAQVELWTMSTSATRDMTISSAGAERDREACQEVRHFDPITMVFSFQCETFDLPAFAEELARLDRSVGTIRLD